MTIGKKLLLSFGAAFGLTLVVGGMAYRNLTTLDKSFDQLVTVHAENQFEAGRIAMFLSDLFGAERGIIAAAYGKDRSAMEQGKQDFGEALAAWRKSVAELRPRLRTAEGRKIPEDMQAAAESLGGMHDELERQISADQLEAAGQILKDKIAPRWKQVNQLADRLVEIQGELMAAARQSTNQEVGAGIWVTSGSILLSLLVALAIALVVRNISGSLAKTTARLAEGAVQVARAASQVSSSSQSLAQGASEQAASLEETSASSEEISSMARKNRENSLAAAELMTQSHQKFVQANQSLDLSIVAMDEINTQSGKISKIIKVIDEIAFQTNILALNAAVEAARAGEAGMGFGVVADEVRNLAQRSAQAARDTAGLIEESIVKSSDGKVKVDQVATAIRSITEKSAKAKALVDDVKSGSQEQASGLACRPGPAWRLRPCSSTERPVPPPMATTRRGS